MPRRHLGTYRRPKPVDDVELERILSAERGPDESRPVGERPAIDYKPIVAVIGLVIFGLAVIAFLLTLRAHG